MTAVFADTGYFIALLSESDHLHSVATAAMGSVYGRHMVTSERDLSPCCAILPDLRAISPALTTSCVL